MNGTCFKDPIGFIKFSISPEFVPLLMDKDLLHKIFVSLRGMKQELHAKSFQVNDICENLPPHVENARRKPQTWCDLQRLEVCGKLGSKTLYYHFAIHTKYTYKIVRKMRQGSPRKPIRLVYRTTFKIKLLCYLIDNYNTDIGNLTLSTRK